MKALPTNNIDETKLEGVFISGLPIKMRLYINNEGRVVKVDKLNVLAQDLPLQAALEKILQEMPFFPAKKMAFLLILTKRSRLVLTELLRASTLLCRVLKLAP